jgi:hypothetical protein
MQPKEHSWTHSNHVVACSLIGQLPLYPLQPTQRWSPILTPIAVLVYMSSKMIRTI